jgi:hypothetical protein
MFEVSAAVHWCVMCVVSSCSWTPWCCGSIIVRGWARADMCGCVWRAVIFLATSASRPRADVAYCIHALARRIAKTHNWTVIHTCHGGWEHLDGVWGGPARI